MARGRLLQRSKQERNFFIMEVKPFWQSKTFWLNMGLGILAQIPKVNQIVTPEVMAAAFTLANVALRFVSKGKITIS